MDIQLTPSWYYKYSTLSLAVLAYTVALADRISSIDLHLVSTLSGWKITGLEVLQPKMRLNETIGTYRKNLILKYETS